MTKKNGKKKNNQDIKKIERMNGPDTDIRGMIYTVVGILCFLLIFYLLTLFILNKDSDLSGNNDDAGEVSISYDNIVIGRSLSMGSGEYLVIYYDTTNEDISSTYSDLVYNYKAKDDHLKIYTVDMGSPFNKNYITDGDSNKSPENVTDMAINGPTLIKVSENKVVEYLEGEEDISSYLE